MPIFMTCPSCNRPGNLPDTFRGGKVKCPGCGIVTEVSPTGAATKPAAASKPATAARPAAPSPSPSPSRPASSTPRPQAPKRSLLDDLDDADDEPLIPPPRTVTTRSAPGQKPAGGVNLPIMLGVGGGAGLLLIIVVLFTMRGGQADAPGPRPGKGVRQADEQVVENVSASSVPSPSIAAASPSFTTSPSYSPPSPPLSQAEAKRRAQDATVYIKVKDGKSQGSGTGFVIRNDGPDAVLIATNRHVISHSGNDDDDDDDATTPGAPKPDATVNVVFRSGEGALEQEVPAVILAKDTTGDPSRDLAILSVKGVKNPPKAIDFSHSEAPALGTEVKIYGFPFGQMMSLGAAGNPAITVNRASVSSLRRDDRGELSLVQIDGSVNPGNSGGPIVDEAGRLVGVTVLKLKVTDGIGLAIPSAHLGEILAGRLGKWTIQKVSGSPQGMELQVSADLADPLGRLKSLNFLVAPSDGNAPPKPANNGPATPMPGAKSFPMTISADRKTATARVTVPFSGSSKNVLVQLTFLSGDNKNYLSVPAVHSVPEGPGRLLAQGEKDAELIDRMKKTAKKLGPLLDPDKDCKLAKDSKSIKISIPGKLHTLSPQIVDKKNRPIKNAPMTLADVAGDFLLHVRVTGEMRPGTDAPPDPKSGRRMPITFMGAGIVLWQNKDNYIRLERTCGTAGGPTLVYRLLVEVCKDGRESGVPYYIDMPEGPMHLMLIRKDGSIRCLFSKDGKKWAMLQEIAAEFPDKLQVGLAGVNISKKPFTAQFEDFVLIEDKDQVAQEFKAN